MDNPQKIRGFRSIRNRILIFSILVTLVPSFGMGWFWLDMTRKATTEKIERKLVDSAGLAEREINLWFKERHYDLRVFAGSFVVADNLRRYLAAGKRPTREQARQSQAYRRKIDSYLTLVRDQFAEYRRLLVLDNEGLIVAASDAPDRDSPVVLPGDWKIQFIRSGFFVGDVSFSAEDGSPVTLVGVPLLSEQDSVRLGFFAMEVRLQGILPLLKAALPETDREVGTPAITLLRRDGRHIMSTAAAEGHRETATASRQVLELFDNQNRLQEFVDDRNVRVVGLAGTFADLPWKLVIAENYDDVFAGVNRARDRIVLIAVLLTVLIGAAATVVASQIVIPLEVLTDGVLRVAGGDLDVLVKIRRNDELGIVTGMFNEMVCRLKADQAKLEQLATTDSLTGLANRKQIMADLAVHFERYRRYASDFSILMIDIDNFKRINDSYGHLAGDAVLVQLAQIFRETLRTLDNAGRYGGEEFLVILGRTDVPRALQTAERIRQAADRHVFSCEGEALHVTVSVGVAGISGDDRDGVSLIGRADKALYEAKAAGRNRVALGSDRPPVASPAGRAIPE